ncbi:MAG: sulfur carrier protein ThiS [Bacillota bacterium]
MITLTVNGKKTELEKPVLVSCYLEMAGINQKAVVVELNYEIPDRHKWNETILKDGDNLEIVKFIGGG